MTGRPMEAADWKHLRTVFGSVLAGNLVSPDQKASIGCNIK